jgi:PAS domain S-box-containing protein
MNNQSILIVDDESRNFDVIEALLNEYDYALNYASTGQEALESLEILEIDVILLDVMMPDMDGIEVCERIKAIPKYRPIPIIMVTALTAKEDLAQCLNAGADDFISKPLNALELRARVQSMLRMKQQYDALQISLNRQLVLEAEKRALLEARNIELDKRSKESSRLLASVVESTDDAIITESLEGIITSWNPAAERLFGYSDAEMIGHPISMLFPPDHLDDETQNLARLMRGERLEHFETVRISKEGKSIDVSATSSPLLNDSGEVVGASKILRDISDRKAKDAKLQIANKELMRANRLKDDFLANMSHELRTPLNSILGMNEGLQEGIFGSINERQLKALRTIENSSTHLLALINDILDVAKIESGQVSLDLAVTNIESICTSSLAFIKQQALTKRIQLIPRIPEYLPEIKLDERRIRQALINLLNNAVKFTLEGGTITLEVSEVQLESSTTNLTPLNYLKIAVIDTGIGISSENIQKLFQPFIQIDSALNRQYDGTGLGLALVKRLVELHGGNVELTSELGVGSCFAINLPFNIGSPAIEEQTDQDLSGQSQIGLSQTEELISPLILLAENNKSNIATFSSYLEAKGYRILLATDGQQAIDLAEAHHPDLILLDIQISGMDGLEAIKEIRLNPDLVNIPIIALTALAMAGDREKCLEAGANEYLSKPIKLKTLADTIWTILQA